MGAPAVMSGPLAAPVGGAPLAEIGGEHGGVAADEAGRTVRYLAPLLHHDHAATERHDEVHVVLDDDERRPFRVELLDHPLDAPNHGGIDAGHRLVEQ